MMKQVKILLIGMSMFCSIESFAQWTMPIDISKIKISFQTAIDTNQLIQVIESLKKQNQVQKALPLAIEISEKYPSEKTMALLADIYLSLKQHQLAMDVLKKAEEKYPKSSSLLYLLGSLYEAMWDKLKATEYYSKVIQLSPYNYKAYLRLSVIELQQQKFAESRSYLNKALNLLSIIANKNPDSTEIVYNLGVGYAIAGEWEEVNKNIQLLKQSKSDLYKDLETMEERLQKQMKDEMEIVKKASITKKNNVKVQQTLANMYLFIKDYDKALETFKWIVQLEPNNAIAYSRTGFICMQKNEYQEAITYITEAIKKSKEKDEEYVTMISNLGHAYLHLNRNREAIELFNEAITISESLKNPSLLNLAYAYYAKAVAMLKLERDLELYFIAKPNFYRFYYFNPLSSAMNDSPLQKRYDAIIQNLKKSIELKFDLSESYYTLGIVNRLNNQISKSILYFLEALRYKPNYLDAILSLGYCYISLEQNELAISRFRQAVSFDKKNEGTYMAIAELFAKTNQKDSAMVMYERVITLNEKQAKAHYEVGRLYAYLGKWKEASQEINQLKSMDVELYNKLMIYVQESRSGKY